MDVDPLDIAYIALGAKQALSSSRPSHGVGAFDGELAYVQACIEHAGLLDEAWERCSDTFPGVWCYEVAEPFGFQMGKHLLHGGDAKEARSILDRIVAAVDSVPA